MAEFQLCQECLLIAKEMSRAVKASIGEARDREKRELIPFAERLKKMTETEWNQIAEDFASSRVAEVRRRALHHQLLTGHRGPAVAYLPFNRW
jgi:hypothetical protein